MMRLLTLRFLPYLVFILIAASYFGFVPLWDGRIFADCLLTATSSAFSISSYNCAAHTSSPFMIIASIVIRMGEGLHFRPEWSLHLLNVTVGMIALVSFNGLIDLFFSQVIHAKDRFLVLFLFSVNPVFLATLFNFNLDSGLTAFFLLTLWLSCSQKFGLAMLSGLIMAGTKETGLPLYLICTAMGIWVGPNLKDSFRRAVLWMTLPLLSFFGLMYHQFLTAGWVFMSLHYPATRVSFIEAIRELVALAFKFQLPDSGPALLASLFVINFQWIQTLVILAAAFKFASKIPKKNLSDYLNHRYLKLFFISALALHFLLRYVPFANARYLLPLHPIVHLLFAASVWSFAATLRMRRLVLILVISLQAVSCWFTVDPISRALFGTVDFGRHQVLTMTSLNQEYFGYGRDQMVYNLQYMKLHDLMNQSLQKIHPNSKSQIVFENDADFGLTGPVDSATFTRTLRYKQNPDQLIDPKYSTLNQQDKRQDSSGPYYLLRMYFVPDSGHSGREPASLIHNSSEIIKNSGYQLTIQTLRQTLNTPDIKTKPSNRRRHLSRHASAAF